MSTAHRHQESPGISNAKLEQLRRDPRVTPLLWRVWKKNSDYDIPFIAGYNDDGTVIYFDRHLPERVTLQHDGRKSREFDPREFYRIHETWEKSLIDGLDWGYYPAHRVATAMEKRAVLERLGPQWWMPYTEMSDQYAKDDEHELIKRVPSDLDLTPYQAPPADQRLLAKIKGAMR